jgi:hypothetical protein
VSVTELFGNAYLRAATAESEAKGIRKAGIYPCDGNILRKHDFPSSDKAEPSKVSSSIIVDPDRTGTSKEYDPVPVRAADISPVPSLPFQTGSISSGCGSAQVITSSPYMLNSVASQKKVTQRKTQRNAEKKKQPNFQKKKQTNRQQKKRGSSRDKRTASSTRSGLFKSRLRILSDDSSDKKDEMPLKLKRFCL